jgi:hypothetical protein
MKFSFDESFDRRSSVKRVERNVQESITGFGVEFV